MFRQLSVLSWAWPISSSWDCHICSLYFRNLCPRCSPYQWIGFFGKIEAGKPPTKTLRGNSIEFPHNRFSNPSMEFIWIHWCWKYGRYLPKIRLSLIGGWGKTPLKKDDDFVTWDDDSNPIFLGTCQKFMDFTSPHQPDHQFPSISSSLQPVPSIPINLQPVPTNQSPPTRSSSISPCCFPRISPDFTAQKAGPPGDAHLGRILPELREEVRRLHWGNPWEKPWEKHGKPMGTSRKI